MLHLLAIDTTTERCSVAVLSRPTPAEPSTSASCLEHTRLAPRLHTQVVLEMVDGLLRAAGAAARAVGLIAFGGGPGSFTGVRIGAAVAQGMALGSGARVLALPSAALVAETARRQTGWRGAFAVDRPSRPGWRYLARYALGDDGCRCVAFDRLLAEEAASDLGPCIRGERFAPNASALAQLAWQRREEAVAPALAQPFYVDGDSPWRPTKVGASHDA